MEGGKKSKKKKKGESAKIPTTANELPQRHSCEG